MKDKLNATTAFDSSEAFRDRMFGCAPSSSGLSNPVLNMNERNYTTGRIRLLPYARWNRNRNVWPKGLWIRAFTLLA